MQDAFSLEEDPSPADLSPELTKHFRGLRMWISLQLLGVAQFRAALEEKIFLSSTTIYGDYWQKWLIIIANKQQPPPI